MSHLYRGRVRITSPGKLPVEGKLEYYASSMDMTGDDKAVVRLDCGTRVMLLVGDHDTIERLDIDEEIG